MNRKIKVYLKDQNFLVTDEGLTIKDRDGRFETKIGTEDLVVVRRCLDVYYKGTKYDSNN